MRISFSLVFVAMTAISGAAILGGCTGDDTNGGQASDSGTGDGAIGDGANGEGGGDGGPCNYATFVQGLITDHTNGTDTPSADLGQNCTDNQDQAEFKSLFP